MFVGDAIDFDVAWEPALEANALIISVVSFLLRAFALSACICSMAVNSAIGALTFMTVSGSTVSSVSNGSSFGPSWFYRSAGQRPYPIKNRRFFKRTITLRPPILIREFSVWYVKYAAQHGASFSCLQFSISLNLSKRLPKNLVFRPKMTIISQQLAEF